LLYTGVLIQKQEIQLENFCDWRIQPIHKWKLMTNIIKVLIFFKSLHQVIFMYCKNALTSCNWQWEVLKGWQYWQRIIFAPQKNVKTFSITFPCCVCCCCRCSCCCCCLDIANIFQNFSYFCSELLSCF